MGKITAILKHRAEHRWLWLVQWPSTQHKQGKAYYAFTRPDGDILFVETAATRRAVSANMSAKIRPAIQEAIAEAQSAA